MFEKLVIVVRKTRLEELKERFNTLEQARFYIEHMGVSFTEYEEEHLAYTRAGQHVRAELEGLLPKLQVLDRSFLPNYIFTPRDIVVTLGQDGLVVNTAKYLDGQPIVAVNPDANRYDGVLLPYSPAEVRDGVLRVIDGRASYHSITMAEAVLNDGQRLLAFNDFLVGQKTHLSARYSLSWRGRTERQSSSGILVSTGAGSTGWLSSAVHMAGAVHRLLAKRKSEELPALRLAWDDPRLVFLVREPFRSKVSGVSLAAGLIEEGDEIAVESHMPEHGVIFSDGIENDALAFNSGSIARIKTAARKTLLAAA